MAKSYLDKYPESAILFYDSEFGTPISYFESFGIDIKRVVHTPVTDIEQLKFDVMKQLSELDGTDKVMIVVDSIGNLASKKEVDDAMDQKAVGDMTRAKQLKSLFRMVTPHLTMKNIPMVVVNHTYKEMGLYPKDIVSGGTGVMYSASNVYIVGRQQDKDGKELNGYHFIVNVEKSRFVREKSKVPVTVSFDGGISTWSGLLDLALEAGYVTKPSNGWYQRKDDTKKYRIADTDCKEFWMPILTNKGFAEYIYENYALGSGNIMNNDEIEESYNWVDTTDA
jgi:RecA/RadA recombinase